jgi:DnaJ-class molecular chaperone
MTEEFKPGDVAPPEAEGEAAGETVCPVCSGEGQVDGERCEHCQGTGTVREGIGGA